MITCAATNLREAQPTAVDEPPNSNLPEGWAIARVADLFDYWGGATPSTSEPTYWGGSVPWISSKDVKEWRISHGTEYVTDKALRETRLSCCPAGSVLVVVRSGILAHTLPVAIADAEVVINQDLKAFYCSEQLVNEWFALALRAKAPEILATNRKDGTTVQSIRFEQLKELEFPIPPLAEQKRIIAKVEALLARVNAARERLAKVPRILKRFRQAVLAAACSGRLTEEWRANRNLESGPQFLERILESRRIMWEANRHSKISANPQKGTSKERKGRYKEPTFPGTEGLPELPDLWVWASTDQLSSGDDPYSLAIGPFGSNLRVSDYTDHGVPLVFVRNIRSGVFSSEDTKYISEEKARELRPHWVAPGDILMTKMGDPPGDACLYPDGQPTSVITADCIKLCLSQLLPKNSTLFTPSIHSWCGLKST